MRNLGVRRDEHESFIQLLLCSYSYRYFPRILIVSFARGVTPLKRPALVSIVLSPSLGYRYFVYVFRHAILAPH